MGAVLAQQGTDDKIHPVAYASRMLNGAEKRYSAIEKEALAVSWAAKHFRYMLTGQHTTIYTDHRPLLWLFKDKMAEGRLARFALNLQNIGSYDIKYRPGKGNANADALSRYPGTTNLSSATQPADVREKLENLKD